MKIVVTGGAGFIGSHLVDRLLRDDWGQVEVVDNLRRGRTENLAQHLEQRTITFHQIDIRDPQALRDVLQGAGLVFHLAAQSNVIGALIDTDYSFTTNVVGTYHVLQAARAAGVRRVIFTSSREAYGEPKYLPVDENHPLNSKNTYGASKVAGEAYCRVFAGNFGLETAVLRLANVYGTRDFERVIPIWLSRAAAGQPLVVYGGQQIIDFIWIDTVIEALLRAAQVDVAGQPINVGSGKGTPLLALADRILALVPTPPQAHGQRLDVQPARPVEVTRFTADVRLMQDLLGLEAPEEPLAGLPLMLRSHDQRAE